METYVQDQFFGHGFSITECNWSIATELQRVVLISRAGA